MTIEYEQALWIEFGDRMSRPKDQDRDEPATPPSQQTRTLGWTGYQLPVKELRGWLDKIPDQATVTVHTAYDDEEQAITATWEVT